MKKEEGGRHTPFFVNYQPQFYIRTTDVTGSIKLLEGKEMVMPGDNVSIEVELQVSIILPVILYGCKTWVSDIKGGTQTEGV